jgi:hypothetical protein
VPAGNALWDAAIADVVVCIIVRRVVVVLTGHVHGEALLGTARRGPQKRQVAHVFGFMVRVIIWLEQSCRGLVAQRCVRDVEVGSVERLVRGESSVRLLLLLRLEMKGRWRWRWWRNRVKRIRRCSVCVVVIW